MRFWKSWIIAKKDLSLVRKRKTILGMLIGLPLVMGIGLPLIVNAVIGRRGFVEAVDTDFISAFAFFFVIIAALLPLYISSYGIVGEKVEKSLEPLLSTPTTDGEILMGKYVGTFIPSLLAVYLGALVYMTLVDLTTQRYFGYFFFPNASFLVLLFVAIPASMTYAITLSVFVSSKVDNVMSAYQGGGVTLIPFLVLYVLSEIGLIKLIDTVNIAIISAGLITVAILMYFISRNTFGREKILTEWK